MGIQTMRKKRKRDRCRRGSISAVRRHLVGS
jgi:hypothetical protein